jgi:hypothetical protein
MDMFLMGLAIALGIMAAPFVFGFTMVVLGSILAVIAKVFLK